MHFQLFSEREKERLSEGRVDVLQYDSIPIAFRNQINHLLHETFGSTYENYCDQARKYWGEVYKTYSREKGWPGLYSDRLDTQRILCEHFQQASTIDALDFIDCAFNLADFFRELEIHQGWERYKTDRFIYAFEELNSRLRSHAMGYEFLNGKLVKISSELLHAEVIRPALQLMHDAHEQFNGPLQEFVDAHGKYRAGEHKDAIVAACRSFESVMKSICTRRGWSFDPHKDTASKLTAILFSNGLIPGYMQTQFDSLRSLLDSGVATIRNKTSGHGQGPIPQPVPEYLVAYALHLTASNIVMLIRADEAMQ